MYERHTTLAHYKCHFVVENIQNLEWKKAFVMISGSFRNDFHKSKNFYDYHHIGNWRFVRFETNEVTKKRVINELEIFESRTKGQHFDIAGNKLKLLNTSSVFLNGLVLKISNRKPKGQITVKHTFIALAYTHIQLKTDFVTKNKSKTHKTIFFSLSSWHWSNLPYQIMSIGIGIEI